MSPENQPMFTAGRAGQSVIVCPMQVERKAAERCGRPVPVIQCGIGRGAIDRAFAWIDALPLRPRHAVLFGIAGGLREPCDRESAWVIDRVVDAATGASAVSPTATLAPAGALASVAHADTIIATPADRSTFAARTGAWLVDMECWAFAEAATARGMAWTIIRGVSDGPLDTMPLEILDLIDAEGNPKLAAAAAATLRNPALAGKLLTLQGRSTRALERAQGLLTQMLDAVDGAPVACSPAHPLVLLGGTFDPPHRRHLGMVVDACNELGASTAVVIPAAANPLKEAAASPPAHRWAMLQLALRDPALGACSAAVVACDCELTRGGTSFTIDTLQSLLPTVPGSTGHASPRAVRLLMGSDAIMSFDRWKDWRAILALVTPAVVVRPPQSHAEVRAWLADFGNRYGLADCASWLLDLSPVDGSSTKAREALARGERPSDIAPAVAELALHHAQVRTANRAG